MMHRKAAERAIESRAAREQLTAPRTLVQRFSACNPAFTQYVCTVMARTVAQERRCLLKTSATWFR